MNIEKLRINGDKAFQNVNWTAIHQYMVSNKHTWFGHYQPTIEDLKRTTANLMVQAISNVERYEKETHVGTGGINIYIFPSWYGVKITYEPIIFKSSSY